MAEEKAAATALAAGLTAGPSAEAEGDEPQAQPPLPEHQQEEEEDATPVAPPAKRRLNVALFSPRPKLTATQVSVSFRKAIMLILGIKNINLKSTYNKYCIPYISTAKIHPQNIQMKMF